MKFQTYKQRHGHDVDGVRPVMIPDDAGEWVSRHEVERLAEQLEAKVIEIDGANERCKLVFEAKNHWADRARAAEAELKRRDAQEPVAWAHRLVNKHSSVVHPWVYGSREKETSEGDIFCVEAVPLYAAAPAAVLPQEKSRISENGVPLALNDYDTGWNECLTAAIVLGCQPEKVVTLPEKYAVSNDRSELVEKSAVMVALDAAGVKWVEGE